MEDHPRQPEEAPPQPPESDPLPAYEPPTLEEHGIWTHITGVSLPIGG